MNQKPDFIVDPDGIARPAKYLSESQLSGEQQASSSSGTKFGSKSTSSSSPGYYLIPIPIGLIITLFLQLFSCSTGGRSDTHFQKGINHLNSGNYSQAIIEFDKAKKQKPDDFKTFLYRSSANVELGNYDDAIGDCNTALQLHPESRLAYLNRGVAYAKLGENEKAISDYTKAIQIKGDYVTAYYNRGLSHMDLNEFDQAISDFNKAIEITLESSLDRKVSTELDDVYEILQLLGDDSNPFQPDIDLGLAYSYRGMAYIGKLDYGQALRDYNKAIDLEPKLSKAYLFRGYTYYTMLEFENAVANFEKVLELKNDPLSEKAAREFLIELGIQPDILDRSILFGHHMETL